jgi:predicted membrane protein (TIGR00267 family)
LSTRDRLFPFLLGFIDGLLTALTLCTGKLMQEGADLDFYFALRISFTALITGCFVFFVAKYAELRGQLIQAEKELNLVSSGRLASTALGRKVLYSSMIDAILSGVSGFIGAFFPLIVVLIDPYRPWITFSFSIAILGIFGWILGKTVGRKAALWSIALILGGLIVIFLGMKLHIVS